MVPLFKPELGEEELSALREIFKTGWVGLGPKTAEFEKKFSEYIGADFAIGLNSCTAALDLSLRARHFGKGEVLVPAITFVSTPHAVLYNNLEPVFVDVDPETLCMDVADFERKITPRTKAVIPVHLGGHPCDMDPIMEIARLKNIFVIEDVANACGGEYKGRKLGSIGDFGCFSFEAKKNMTTGDGGMITTNDESSIAPLKRLRWCGIDKDTWKRFSENKNYSWYYEVAELGWKYNMNDISAAIGLVQLQKLDAMLAKKSRIVNNYKIALKDLLWLELPVEREWAKGAWWLFIVKVPERDRFIEHLAGRGITTGVHFMPMHLHPLYKKYGARVPKTEKVWQKMVTLPLYPSMTNSEFEEVVDAVKTFTPH